MNLYVAGSLAYDRILYYPEHFKDHFFPEKIHALSVSFHIESINESFGGAGGNIAYNLKLLGSNPMLIGTVGDDWYKYDEWLKQQNISTDYIMHVPGTLTPQAHIMTDRDNNQITGFHQGAGATSYTKDLPTDKNALAIIAPSQPQDMTRFAQHYQTNGIKYLFDPGQQIPTFTKEEFTLCVEGAWIFITNDYELTLSLEKLGWTFDQLLRNVPIVITTLGENGSKIYEQGNTHHVDRVSALVVTDPTGAGDAYRAGLMRGIQCGLDIKAAAQLGATVASYSIEQNGTQVHTFTVKELLERYQQAFNEKISLT